MGSVITAGRARELASSYAASVPQLRSQLAALLLEGVLSEDYVLQVPGPQPDSTLARCSRVLLRCYFSLCRGWPYPLKHTF